MNAVEILDREFLGIRAKLLEVAASLDRIERASGNVADDDRMTLIHKGVEIIAESRPGMAEQIQLLFSRDYQPNWREEFQMTADV